TDRGSPVAVATAGVGYDDLVRTVLHHEAAASRLAVAELDELAAVAHANLLLRAIIANAQSPRPLGKPVEHGEPRSLRLKWRGDERNGRDRSPGLPQILRQCPFHDVLHSTSGLLPQSS